MTRLAQISIDQIGPKMTVFGRFACLGRAILSKSFRESSVRVLNHQKLRIDGLVDILMDQNLILKNNYDKNQVDGFSISKDLKGWIAEVYNQNLLRDLYSADLFFFDSFSDLTDRLFLHNDFAFFAHGIDVRDQENLVDNGYLDTSNMLESFSRFLSFVSSLNSAPIFMIHYSSRHDSRNLFQKRSVEIHALYKQLETRFTNFNFIDLSEAEYQLGERDNFPYHYARETIEKLVYGFKCRLIENGLRPSRYLYRVD